MATPEIRSRNVIVNLLRVTLGYPLPQAGTHLCMSGYGTNEYYPAIRCNKHLGVSRHISPYFQRRCRIATPSVSSATTLHWSMAPCGSTAAASTGTSTGAWSRRPSTGRRTVGPGGWKWTPPEKVKRRRRNTILGWLWKFGDFWLTFQQTTFSSNGLPHVWK